MVSLGYTLSSEEFTAPELLDHAEAAEAAGFEYALISDHFHPWTTRQGNSPFVWSVLGALAERTQAMRFGTGVTCPIQRIHPAIIAQAAATTEALMPGRFFLGVGTGERLNEHIIGEHWPENGERIKMLDEAIALIRRLWSGDEVTEHGEYFTTEHAQLFSLPDRPPPIYVAAGGSDAAEVAGRSGDGLVAVAPSEEIVDAYDDAATQSGPRIGQIQFCWDGSREAAVQTALEYWPNAAWGGDVSQEIAVPADFEAIAELVTEDSLTQKVTASNDPQDFIDAIREYERAGFDHVYFHQIGPRQREAIEFFSKEVKPAFAAATEGVRS